MTEIMTAVFLGICTVSDIRKMQIYRFLPLIFIAAASILHLVKRDLTAGDFFAGIVFGGLLLVFSWVTREAMGYGDALVVMACGAALGFMKSFSVFFLALVFSAVWSGTLLIVKKAGRKERFPFLPFLLAAQICGMFF